MILTLKEAQVSRSIQGSNVVYIFNSYRTIFNNWKTVNAHEPPIIMLGDGKIILEAPWRLLRQLIGWDLRNLTNLGILYDYSEQRRDIFKTLKHQYHCRQIIEINTGYGFPLVFDAIYTRKPRNDVLYYIFMHLMDINRE